MSEINEETLESEEGAAKANETKEEKFVRIGQCRMTKAIESIGRLENLSNKSSYGYTQEQVDKMFGVLEKKLADAKAKFVPKTEKEDNSFTF